MDAGYGVREANGQVGGQKEQTCLRIMSRTNLGTSERASDYVESEYSTKQMFCQYNIKSLFGSLCRLIFFPQGDDLGTEWSQLFRHYVDSYYICSYIINVVGQFS